MTLVRNFHFKANIVSYKAISISWTFLPLQSRHISCETETPNIVFPTFRVENRLILIWIFHEIVLENLELSRTFSLQNEWAPWMRDLLCNTLLCYSKTLFQCCQTSRHAALLLGVQAIKIDFCKCFVITKCGTHLKN